MSVVDQSLVLARRNLLRSTRNPASIVGAVVSPAVFFLGFLAVLKGIMDAPGLPYVQYLTPAVTVQAMLFAAISSAYYVADDSATGILARARSMPVSRGAPVLGRSLNDVVRALVGIVVVVGLGHVFGFRFGSVAGALGYVAIAVGFAVTLALGTGLFGLKLSNPQATLEALSMPYLPLLMLSTAFVPADRFPGWIEPIVRQQPVSRIADALRALAGGSAPAATILPALAWIVGMAVVFGALCVRAYGRPR